ncbi:hypothetical protein [Longimicrobium sp.]|uniref:hypothetical protein n=1 Tax=Longimicrobium sp. TaxID=2029185 RepID=UPI002E320332|nr:hypothetical protein [Longimicrobium sp.]HEX6037530.1 hypothetical protein [Longimicrobium sp.]
MTTVSPAAAPGRAGDGAGRGAARGSAARLARVAVPLAFCLAGLLMAHHPVLLSGFARMQPVDADSRLVNYFLEHTWLWLRQAPGHEAFWEMPFFVGQRGVAAYSETMLGIAPLYWLYRGAGFGVETSLQLWVLTLSTLNFTAAYLFLRRAVGVRMPAACAGAFLFAFAGMRLSHIDRLHLQGQFYSVLAAYALVRVFALRPDTAEGTGGPRATGWIAVFCAAVAAQLYAGFYMGFFLGMALLFALAWALVRRPYRARLLAVLRRNAAAVAGFGAVAALAVAPMAMRYLSASREVAQRTFLEAYCCMPRPHTWAYMGPDNWLYGWIMRPDVFVRLPFPHEQENGLGLVAFAAAALGLWHARRRPPVQFLLVVALATIVVSTTLPGQITLWHLPYRLVPGASAIRYVARIGLLVLLPAAVGLALSLDRLGRRHVGLALAVGAVALLEQGRRSGSYDKAGHHARIARLASHIPAGCPRFYFSPVQAPGRPVSRLMEQYQGDAQWMQLLSGIPTVNGYSGNIPPGYADLRDPVIHDAADEARIRNALETWGRTHGMDRICWVRRPAEE